MGLPEQPVKRLRASRAKFLQRQGIPYALIDFLAWHASVILAALLRFEFDVSRSNIGALLILGSVVGVFHLIFGTLTRLYGGRHVAGSFDEAIGLFRVVSLATIPAFLVSLAMATHGGIPRSTIFIAVPIFLVFSFALRGIRRLWGRHAPDPSGQKRAIVYGAGTIAESLIPQLLADSSRAYLPVGLLDDDPDKHSRWISGVKMQGTLADLPRAVNSLQATALIVALPRANHELLQELRAIALPLNLEVVLIPSFSEILAPARDSFPLRELGIEDLVGRKAISVDSEKIASYLNGKTVLVTGAGGSIGVELCRQVSQYSPRRLVFLDRDETGLQLAQITLTSSGLLDGNDFVLADIRERKVIEETFFHVKPDIVFHAAALKHLPALEKFPSEAWKTNVLGTANVLAAAAQAGTSHFVNISTDKAADPSSVLGYSKKISEELTSWYSSRFPGAFHSVRFGNVLGSRGSLVPTVRHAIEKGGPVFITDPGATRYFMTIPEACRLVLQAGLTESKNGILLFNMGKPVRVLEIVEKMIEMSGKPIEIVYTGLRKGEKLHENLYSAGEKLEDSDHPLIWQIAGSEFDPERLFELEKHFMN